MCTDRYKWNDKKILHELPYLILFFLPFCALSLHLKNTLLTKTLLLLPHVVCVTVDSGR